MTVPELLRALRAHGATLTLHGGTVNVAAPVPLPDALMDALRAHKADVAATLRDQATRPPRSAAALLATVPHAPCHGGCGRLTPHGWECLSCRTAGGGSAS